MEEVDNLGDPGVVIIDDLRWPGEYNVLRERQAFLVRLVTTHRVEPKGFDPNNPKEEVDGLLTHCAFHAEVPAKGLVPQAALEKIVADLWYERIVGRSGVAAGDKFG